MQAGLGKFVNADPVTIATNAVLPQSAQFNGQVNTLIENQIAGAIARNDQSDDTMLDAVAKVAWFRETIGKQGPPEAAPAGYVSAWKDTWHSGGTAPLTEALDASLTQRGLTRAPVFSPTDRLQAPNGAPSDVFSPSPRLQAPNGVATADGTTTARMSTTESIDSRVRAFAGLPPSDAGDGGPMIRGAGGTAAGADTNDGGAAIPARPSEIFSPSSRLTVPGGPPVVSDQGDGGPMVRGTGTGPPAEAVADPFDFVVRVAADQQYGAGTSQNVKSFLTSVASGIAKGETWADGYSNDVARMAWYRETEGRMGGPQNAPRDYVTSWKAAWRNGDNASPYQEDLSNKLRWAGVQTPADAARAAEVQQVMTDWRANVSRLNQNIGESYRNPANAGSMSLYACGAASFATTVNAVNPEANLKVDDAMNVLNRGGRNLINPVQGLRLADNLTEMAPAFGEVGVQAEARNFTQQSLQQHFTAQGGPIVFSGPRWGDAMKVPSVPAHIYTATDANQDGLTIVDSSGSNRTRMSWREWQVATGSAANGAGIYAIPKAAPAPAPPRSVPVATMSAPAQPAGTSGGSELDPAAPAPGGKRTLPTGTAYEEQVLPAATKAGQATGLPPELFLAIADNENGPGNTSDLGKEHNNFFGIKADPSWTERGGRTVTMGTYEVFNGQRVWVPDATWRSYDTPEQGLTGLKDFLQKNRRYTDAGVFKTNDAKEIVQRMFNAGYATDPAWVSKIHSRIDVWRKRLGGR